MMPGAVNDVCMPTFCFYEIIFSSKIGDNNSLVGMSWRYKFLGRYKNIALKMSLSLGSDDSFNLYLQKSIARWEPSFSEVFFWIQAWQLFHTYLLLITQRLRKIIFTNTMTLLLTYSNLLCFTSMSSTFALRCFGEARGTSCKQRQSPEKLMILQCDPDHKYYEFIAWSDAL